MELGPLASPPRPPYPPLAGNRRVGRCGRERRRTPSGSSGYG